MKKIMVKGLALAFLGTLFVAGSAFALPIIDGPAGPFNDMDVYNFAGGPVTLDAGTYNLLFTLSGETHGGWDASGPATDYFYIHYDLGSTSENFSYIPGLGTLSIEIPISVDLATDDLFNLTAWSDTTSPNHQEIWNLDGASLSETPEPATMLLFGTGIAGLAGISRRRKKDSA